MSKNNGGSRCYLGQKRQMVEDGRLGNEITKDARVSGVNIEEFFSKKNSSKKEEKE